MGIQARPLFAAWLIITLADCSTYICLDPLQVRIDTPKENTTFTSTNNMKLFAPIVLALAAASEAAFCNGGWGLPGGSTCPGAYVSSVQTTTRKQTPTNIFVSQPNSFCVRFPDIKTNKKASNRNISYSANRQERLVDSSLHSGIAYTPVVVGGPLLTVATVV